jgi:hypothetical protein
VNCRSLASLFMVVLVHLALQLRSSVYASRLASSSVIRLDNVVGKSVPMWSYGSHSFDALVAPTVSHPVASHVGIDNASSEDMFDIQRVVVVHRHGDRSQIKKSLGQLVPDSAQLRNFWKSRLPNSDWEAALDSVANIEMHHSESDGPVAGNNQSVTERIYAGQDIGKFPFGMLTGRGARQLASVGRMLSQRYGKLLLKEANSSQIDSSTLYVRSSNYCRTQLSVRSLLLGLFGRADEESSSPNLSHSDSAVTIVTRPRSRETMFPAEDHTCSALRTHTARVVKATTLMSAISEYESVKGTMEQLLATTSKFQVSQTVFPVDNLGCELEVNTSATQTCTAEVSEDRFGWPDIKEVLTCHHVHESGFLPVSVDDAYVSKCTEIASHVWFEKYSVSA